MDIMRTALPIWLVRLAWFAVAWIAAMPVLGRWLDPAPGPLEAPADASGIVELMADIVLRLAPRAWMLPTTIALASSVLLCSLASFALRAHSGAPWPRRRASLWPVLALPLSLLVSVVLDEHLPEFHR